MLHKFNTGIAKRYGIHAALMADYIRSEIIENEFHGRACHNRQTWMRSSQMMFTAVMPYLSKHAVHRSIKKLIQDGILVRGEFNVSRFDRTAWYSFTQFGYSLMIENENEDYQ